MKAGYASVTELQTTLAIPDVLVLCELLDQVEAVDAEAQDAAQKETQIDSQ